jgi:hypothetical protein
MSFGKNKLLLSFAFIGFLLGSALYFVFDRLIANTTMYPVPILEIILKPWFLSGIAGSFLSVIAVFIAAHFSAQK